MTLSLKKKNSFIFIRRKNYWKLRAWEEITPFVVIFLRMKFHAACEKDKAVPKAFGMNFFCFFLFVSIQKKERPIDKGKTKQMGEDEVNSNNNYIEIPEFYVSRVYFSRCRSGCSFAKT